MSRSNLGYFSGGRLNTTVCRDSSFENPSTMMSNLSSAAAATQSSPKTTDAVPTRVSSRAVFPYDLITYAPFVDSFHSIQEAFYPLGILDKCDLLKFAETIATCGKLTIPRCCICTSPGVASIKNIPLRHNTPNTITNEEDVFQ